MAIGEKLKAANRAANERQARRLRGINAKANKAAASQWVGGPGGCQMTAGELEAWAASMKAACVARNPEWF